MAEFKYTEAFTTSVQVAPTATTGISSSSLLDMSVYEKALFEVIAHRLPDTKGAGNITVTVFESDVATWSASATVITTTVGTVGISNTADPILQLSMRCQEMSINNNLKKYVGAYVASNTSTVLCLNVKRWKASYNPVT